MDLERQEGGERWFLRVQGHTLGPLLPAEVLAGLRAQEFSAEDKICSSREPTWRTVGEHPLFANQEFLRARAAPFASPPSPRILRLRAPAAIPAASEIVIPAPVPPVAETSMPVMSAVEEQEIEIETLPEAPKPALEITAPIPFRPSYEPIFIAPSVPRSEPAAVATKTRVIQIELKLPDRPLKVFVLALLLVGIALAAGNWLGFSLARNKTRDPKDFRPSDPSSPTTSPFEAGDPIPPLKAPTRPQRE